MGQAPADKRQTRWDMNVDCMYWISDLYSELSERISQSGVDIEETRSGSEAFMKLNSLRDFLLHRHMPLDMVIRWKRWYVHLIVAMSYMSDPEFETVLNWIWASSGTEISYSYPVLNDMLRRTLDRGRVSMILPFTTEQL